MGIIERKSRSVSADSAAKVLNHMQRSAKVLRAGHGLADNVSIQRRLESDVPGPTTLYSSEAFSLYKLVGRQPLPEPRSALFDICTQNFHHALPATAVKAALPPERLGKEVSLAPAPAQPQTRENIAEGGNPELSKPSKPKKDKDKKDKKEKKDKDKKGKHEKKDKKDKDKKEKKDKSKDKDKDKKRKRADMEIEIE